MLGMHFVKHTEKYIILVVCRLDLTAFSKIFDFVKKFNYYSFTIFLYLLSVWVLNLQIGWTERKPTMIKAIEEKIS